ncbi:MAG: NAD-dependent epimerase/dehydratase family protein [Candidatus Yanofskybacteria bacterium]|nr:NAD-dependent epimerase/dehydratase family protein [Candidatus Yanofskybacteria bacterium]
MPKRLMAESTVLQKDIREIVNAIKKEAKKFEGARILVTGSYGFMGQYIVAVFDELNASVLKKPCTIITVDHRKKKRIFNLRVPGRVQDIIRDVARPLSISGPVDFIVHAAGIMPPRYQDYPLETIAVATEGTRNLLELAKEKKIKSFVFFSSADVYGNPDARNVPTPETYLGSVSSIDARACYCESKRLGETYCTTYNRVYGVPAKIIRFFNVYGPNLSSQMVLPQFITRTLNGEELMIKGTGTQSRTYCYITDAVVGFLKILLNGEPGEVYNMGTDQEEISLLKMVKVIGRVTNKKIQVNKIPYLKDYPSNEPKRRSPDLKKVSQHLGFRPRIDFETGVSRMIEWYREAQK